MPKKQNPWMSLVMATKKANPSLKFSEVLKKAKAIYGKKR